MAAALPRLRLSNKGRAASLAILGLGVLLAGCQPLPHPFADDRPPAALLRVRDVAGVSIAPIVGKPAASAEKLAGAVAKALLKRDIPASDRTANLDSYQLYARIVESRPDDSGATLTVLWRLYDAKGRTVGQHTAKIKAAIQDWDFGNAAPIERLAGLIADGVLPLIEDKVPVVASAASKAAADFHVAIGKISGAPGDGAQSLATAVAAVLKERALPIAGNGQKADLTVDAEISVTPVKPDKQHVKIVWHVRRADGSEIGNVAQENDVPRGTLDGTWGDLAYSIAIAASDGLTQLVARGMPEPKS